MFHLIGSLVGNLIEIGVGVTAGVIFKDNIVNYISKKFK